MQVEYWGHMIYMNEPEITGWCEICDLEIYDEEPIRCQFCGCKIHADCLVECETCGEKSCPECMTFDDELDMWFCGEHCKDSFVNQYWDELRKLGYDV